MTLIQNNLEVNLLTNKITSIASLETYQPAMNQRPLARSMIANLFARMAEASPFETIGPAADSQVFRSSPETQSVHPSLSLNMRMALVAETTRAVVAIGGHQNPPLRHVVGVDAVMSVKESLKIVSEELEELIEISYSVDIEHDGGGVMESQNGEKEQ